MTKAPRPSLTSLADRMAKKPGPPPAVAPSSPEPGASPSPSPDTPAAAKAEPKDTRVQVMARMTPAERKSLRRIALEQDTTVQALIEEAIRDLIRRHDGR